MRASVIMPITMRQIPQRRVFFFFSGFFFVAGPSLSAAAVPPGGLEKATCRSKYLLYQSVKTPTFCKALRHQVLQKAGAYHLVIFLLP